MRLSFVSTTVGGSGRYFARLPGLERSSAPDLMSAADLLGRDVHAVDVDDGRGAQRCLHRVDRRGHAQPGRDLGHDRILHPAALLGLAHRPADRVERHADAQAEEAPERARDLLRALAEVLARCVHRLLLHRHSLRA
jgi:hypothetical protein